MDNARGHMAILAGAGVAAALVSAYVLAARQPETAAAAPVVVTLPQRAPPAPQPAVRPQAGSPQPKIAAQVGPGPMSADPASLARTLQRELKRVGCYDGDISGVWNAPSRAAMKAFTERVNATLPVDAPDQVLLALVQAHQGRACGAACRSGEAQAADGRCLPGAIIAKAGRPAPPPPEPVAKAEPAIASVPAPVLVTRKPPMAAPPSEPAPRIASAAPEPLPTGPQVLPPGAPVPLPAESMRGVRHAGPTPAVSVYGRRIRRFVRRAPKPAAVARSLFRSLARAAQGPW